MVKLRTDHHLSWLKNKADFLGYSLLHFLFSLTSGYLCMGYLQNLGAVSLFLSPLNLFCSFFPPLNPIFVNPGFLDSSAIYDLLL